MSRDESAFSITGESVYGALLSSEKIAIEEKIVLLSDYKRRFRKNT